MVASPWVKRAENFTSRNGFQFVRAFRARRQTPSSKIQAQKKFQAAKTTPARHERVRGLEAGLQPRCEPHWQLDTNEREFFSYHEALIDNHETHEIHECSTDSRSSAGNF